MDWVALVAPVAVGAVASVATAYVTARLTARTQLRRWRAEQAEKYAALAAEDPAKAQALARQFAVGVLIIELEDPLQREKIFIPPHTRMIAGRDKANEVVLPSPASRQHFAISADGNRAYVEDLGSANGTVLNEQLVSGRTALRDGDILRINSRCYIEFRTLMSNM